MKYKVTLNGKTYEVEVEETDAVIVNVSDAAPVVPPAAPAHPAPVASAAPAVPAAAADGVKVLAPMPGTILAMNVSVGQAVKAGKVLLVLEAMKMENEITAPSDGIVKQILVQKGATVDTDAALVVIG